MNRFIKGVGEFLFGMMEQALAMTALIMALLIGQYFKSLVIMVVSFVVLCFLFLGLAHFIKGRVGKNKLD